MSAKKLTNAEVAACEAMARASRRLDAAADQLTAVAQRARQSVHIPIPQGNWSTVSQRIGITSDGRTIVCLFPMHAPPDADERVRAARTEAIARGDMAPLLAAIAEIGGCIALSALPEEADA